MRCAILTGLWRDRAFRALGDGAVVALAWPLGMFREIFCRAARRATPSLFVHMSLGLGVILAACRSGLVWRALDPPPPAIFTPRFEPWLGLAAKAGHCCSTRC